MKKKHLEVAPDGKQELVPGAEPLKKEPKKKGIKDRWRSLKKALDNATAFMPMEEDEGEGEPEGGAPQEANESAAASQPVVNDNVNEVPNADGQTEDKPDSSEDAGNAPPGRDETSDEELESALEEAGYSKAEIAHIVHGHVAPDPSVDQAKVDSENMGSQIDAQNKMSDAEQARAHKDMEAKMKADHASKLNQVQLEDAQEKKQKNKLDIDHHKRMLDLEYEKARAEEGDGKAAHQKRMNDIEYEEAKSKRGLGPVETEHQKKMLALEYEAAKKEKELEIEFKKREHELKLKLMEEGQKHKVVEQKEKHKMKLSDQKANAKLKKSEDEEDET